MANFNFDTFLANLRTNVEALAKGDLANLGKEVAKDTDSFVQSARSDLKTWTQQLADGKIDKDGFENLLEGEKDLAELTALTQAGLAEAALDQFTNALFNTIVTTAVKMI